MDNSLGGNTYDLTYDVTVDIVGNVYASGGFTGTADFDPGPGTVKRTASPSGGAFVAKYTLPAPWTRGRGR